MMMKDILNYKFFTLAVCCMQLLIVGVSNAEISLAYSFHNKESLSLDSISPPLFYGFRSSSLDSTKCAYPFQLYGDGIEVNSDTLQSTVQTYTVSRIDELIQRGDYLSFYFEAANGSSPIVGLSDSIAASGNHHIDCGIRVINNNLYKVSNVSENQLYDTIRIASFDSNDKIKILLDSGIYRFYVENQQVYAQSISGADDSLFLNIVFTEQGESIHSIALYKDCPDGNEYERTPSDDYEITLTAKGTPNRVRLRWMPRDYEILQYLRTQGVDVFRYTVSRNNIALKEDDILASYREIKFNVLPASSGIIDNSGLSEEKKQVARRLISEKPKIEDPEPSLQDISQQLEAEENLSAFYSLVSFSDWELTTLLGLGIEDTSVVEGEEYRYLVRLNAIDLSYATEVLADSFGIGFPATLKVEGKDRLAHFTMDLLEFGEYYSGIYLEKREKGTGASFQRVSDLPIVPGLDGDNESFNIYDTLPDNETVFEYRAQGIDYFGELSSYSNIVEVQGVNPPLKEKPVIDTVYPSPNAQSATIEWIFPDSLESKIYGYNVYVTKQIGREYDLLNETIIHPTERQWVHDSVYYLNHYFVEAIDENEHSLLSMSYMYQPIDSTPPQLPTNISGKIYKSGKISVEWDPSTSEDIQFYKVYFSYDPVGGFTDISGAGVYRNRFHGNTDVKTMTKKAYVAVSAVDFHENESVLTAPIALEIPDLIPPNKPLLTSIRAAEQGVYMDWMVSSSDDVERHKLQRKDGTTGGGWLDLVSFGKENILKPNQLYLDSTVEESSEYAYRLSAIDSSGNISYSSTYYITSVTKYNPQSFTSIACDKEEVAVFNKGIVNTAIQTEIGPNSANITANILVISWEYPDMQDVESFTLYRAAPGRPFIEYGYISSDPDYNNLFDQWNAYGYTLEHFVELYEKMWAIYSPNGKNGYVFLDPNIIPGRRYQYKLVANFSNGMQSRFSKITSCIHD